MHYNLFIIPQRSTLEMDHEIFSLPSADSVISLWLKNVHNAG